MSIIVYKQYGCKMHNTYKHNKIKALFTAIVNGHNNISRYLRKGKMRKGKLHITLSRIFNSAAWSSTFLKWLKFSYIFV